MKQDNPPAQKCSVCGYIISAQEIIPAKGHGETEVRNAVPAEIGKNGYTGDTYCKVCGEKIAEGKVIPALGRETGAVADTSNHAPNVPAAPAKDKWDDASDRIAKASDGTLADDRVRPTMPLGAMSSPLATPVGRPLTSRIAPLAISRILSRLAPASLTR